MRVFFGVVVVAACGAGCGLGEKPLPEDRAIFPTGLALHTANNHLIVVSSDFDLSFDTGGVHVVDLEAARPNLTGPDAVVVDAFVSSVSLPPFGDRPIFDAAGEHLFLTTRGENQLNEIDFDGGELSCGGTALCGQAPFVAQLANNDPFDVVLFDGPGVRGIVTHLSSNEAELFTFDPEATGATRLRIEAESVLFGELTSGVRSAVLRPADHDADTAQLFVALEQRLDGTLTGVELGVFDVPGVNRGSDAVVNSVDVTGNTGSLSARAIAVVPDPGGGVAVVVALRAPDALARFRFNDADRTFSLTVLSETCKEPTNFAFDDGGVDGVPRLFLTCQAGEVVQAIDPVTLDVRDSVRFFGRGPYDIVVDSVNQEAFVSFFLDNSIGVLSLADGKLAAKGRIGEPLPPPDDGRE
ncbi:MAG: hypothetical protein Q8O67_07060 [Deltaproteobacteria bacterium]|nr:hypothetical protein [Deltaproteobacteria bacterium]